MAMTAYTFRKQTACYVFVTFNGFIQVHMYIGHAQIQGGGGE